jgi:hypothetical protein
MWTIRGVFDDRGEAELSLLDLVEAGMPRECGHLEAEADWWAELYRRSLLSRGSDVSLLSRLRIAFTRRVPGAPGTYADARRRGSPCVIVHVNSAMDAELAGRLLIRAGAIEVQREQLLWRRAGASTSKA